MRFGYTYVATDGAGEYESAEDLLCQTPDLTNALENSLDSVVFQDFMSTLPDDSYILLTKLNEGYNFKEIAEFLGVKQSAVSNRWRRISDKYREFLNTAYIG